jgi:hypothetical protein
MALVFEIRVQFPSLAPLKNKKDLGIEPEALDRGAVRRDRAQAERV